MPAETLMGAIKAHLIAAAPTGSGRGGSEVSVGGRIWRSDQVPESATLPYLALTGLGASPVLRGDQRTLARRASLSVDLWERVRDASPSLLRAICAALDGAELEVNSGRAYKTRLDSITPVPDPGTDLVHHALTISLATDPHAL